VRLDNSTPQQQSGSSFSAQPARCFTIPLSLGPQKLNTIALLDSGASACFLDENFASRHKIRLVQKSKPIHVEVIDGRPLLSGSVTHETEPIEVAFKDHSSRIIFNIIKTPSSPVILGLSWLEQHNPSIDWKLRRMTFPKEQSKSQPSRRPKVGKPLFIGARAFVRSAKEGAPFVIYAAPTSAEKSSTASIPELYKDFEDVFHKKNADMLPEHRPYDCPIDLQEGAQPPFGPIYNLSQTELAELRKYIDENLAKNFIRHSKSPAGAPILFVKKKDGSLRMCVDYRGLNKVTKKNRYPLPLISGLLEQLGRAKIFTKIDLRGAYNLVRIKEGDEWKTTFRTRYGHFEYNVMPFGLTNAPAVFQHMMNDIFREHLDDFVVIYLDDILIFSKNEEEHEKHVRLVLEKLRERGLYAKLEKCLFHQTEMEFLGFIATTDGLKMDPKKVEAIVSWEVPKTVRDVQCFLGFANFYRIFIKYYSQIAAPLTRLTCKDKLEWGPQAENAFQDLKTAFTTAPILVHPDFAKAFYLETDASDFALGAVLSQMDEDKKLHPVAFYSRKFSAAEINYEIHDKELLAIVDSFQEWRHFLEGAAHPVTVYTDHKNLEYFMSARILNRRQARWNMSLSRFDFVITYRPGKQQGLSDALSRRSYLAPKAGEAAFDQQCTTLLKPEHFRICAAAVSIDTDFLDQVRTATIKDSVALEIKKRADDDKFKVEGDLLYFEERLYIPKGPTRLRVLQSRHDFPAAGHFGYNKTLELISRDFWWPQMWKEVKEFVLSCDICSRSKNPRHRPYGLLQPLPIPHRPWSSVSMDFITDLPPSNSFDSIFVVVDRLTKMAHFIPCKKTSSSEDTARFFLDNVYRYHGLPDDIVSDRGTQFVSKFWRSLFEILKVDIKLSSAFHPQTDGQTERVNQVLEQYLRCTINYQQDDWTEYLPFAEFAYNNTLHASTQQTPFFANYGYHPKLDLLNPGANNNPAAEGFAKQLSELQATLRLQLQTAQESYKASADKFRNEAPTFKIGDKVWLLRRNIKTKRPCDKLDYRRLGPFVIQKQINPVAYRLELPAAMKVHPVFHVSLLESYRESAFPGRVQGPPPSIEIENHEEYEVEKVLDSRRRRGNLEYFVHWSGYDINERTWEAAENLANAPEKVQEFHQRYPHKPKPFRR
jgi:hypothetical protein